MQAATQAQKLNLVVEEARSPLEFGTAGGNASVMRQGGFVVSDKTVSNQKESNTIFEKYLNPSVLKQQSGYHSSSSGSLMGRGHVRQLLAFLSRGMNLERAG